MNCQEQRNVAKAIAGAFLASCLASGAMVTVANAETMATPPAAKTQSNAKAYNGGMMRHGCSSKTKTKTQKSGM